jgi:hypothetical protein
MARSIRAAHSGTGRAPATQDWTARRDTPIRRAAPT